MHALRRMLLAALLAAPLALDAQQPGSAGARATDARALARRQDYQSALAIYDSLLRADSTSRDAVLGRAEALAWAGRASESIAGYERWLRTHPSDVEAKEALARSLSWAGKWDDAERLYATLAAHGSIEAEKGLARLAARRGHLDQSVIRWRELIERNPKDAECWAGLAQALRWAKRDREARAALTRALEIEPGNNEAAAQLRTLDALLAPRATSSVVLTDDTDDNRVTTVSLSAALTPSWDGELSTRAQVREATLPGVRARSYAGAVDARWSSPHVALHGSLGAAHLGSTESSATDASHDVLTGTAVATARASSRATVGVGISRAPFDETAPLIISGIMTTAATAGAGFDLRPALSLTAEVEHAWISGAEANARTTASAAINWQARHALGFALSARGFGYASDPLDGYFAPRLYTLTEASARLAVGQELGWSATIEGGVGAQTVDARGESSTRAAERAALAVLFRPSPAVEWGLSASFATAASAATGGTSAYRASAIGLRGRVSF